MTPQPDLILHNGHIVTVDADFSTAEAVAIADGKFLMVGSDAEVLATAGAETRKIDLGGKTVIPGLFDSHLHLHYVAMQADRVPLIDCRSIADVQAAIAERTKATPKGEWIICQMGWHESLLNENRLPTRDELDEAAPDHPVFVPRGGHVGSGNSLALKAAGISEDTADPPGGLIVREIGSQRPTGVVLESAAYMLRNALPPPPAFETEKAMLRDAMQLLNSYGIVAAMDPGLNPHQIELYDSLRQDGEVTVRTDLMYRAYNLEDTKRAVALTDFHDDDLLRYVGVKFMLDGGVEGALHYEPYQIVPGEQNDPEYRGLSLLPAGGEPEFIEALKLVARAGMQAQTHGVGDACIDTIVRCYLAAAEDTPIRDLNWVVMHLHNPTEEVFGKIRDGGILVTAQNQSALLGANKVKWWGRPRAEWSTPIRRMLDEGLLVGGGTDAPILPIDPFICMWWMVTRKTLQGDCLGPNQAITIREALELYTVNNARIMGVEDRRGAIEPGKLADLVVLNQNLLEVTGDAIRDTQALMTVLGGKIVHQAPGMSA
ncbi:amidohydrolase family protein [Paracoccus sp. S-4012]|uniref:amidohydrolase n=1 Tax=Paracoccus sp. S-4012 TaxID=2665648 RepID=UPI0012B0637F|nr:amidohydrolase [Paracoccus sp. S-4012]MRX50434.1 amidohydrolase family protein [Paracoccus sp. S-4012]